MRARTTNHTDQGQRRPARRLTVVAAGVALVALTATGCGDSSTTATPPKSAGASGKAEAPKPVVLTGKQAEQALLAPTDLAPGYVKTASDDDDSSAETDVGCLDSLQKDDVEPAVKKEVTLEDPDSFGTVSINNEVESYRTEDKVAEEFARVRAIVDDCDHVDTTVEGAHMVLDLSSSDEESIPAVDDQINITASGSVAQGAMKIPVTMHIAGARIANNATYLFVTSIGDGSDTKTKKLIGTAVRRLGAVMHGNDPAADASGSNSGSDAGAQLPLDGGHHTWPSGVSMKLQVTKVEPWGDTDDFCGDGSCGVANPNDTRLVLKYTVKVPADYSQPFDPTSCPGELHVRNGNDDDALGGVFGDYSKELGGKIFPGDTKYGVDEYYIEKKYADAQFYLESSCGAGEDYSLDPVYFFGPAKDLR